MDHASTRYTPRNILEGAGAAVILPSTKEVSVLLLGKLI